MDCCRLLEVLVAVSVVDLGLSVVADCCRLVGFVFVDMSR
jgi:hypothetical protein